MRTPLRAAAACSVAILLVACGAEAPPTPVPARDFGDPGVVTGSGYEMRYAALQATLLPAEVTATYGIPQRSDRLVVNVSVLARREEGLPAAVRPASRCRSSSAPSRPVAPCPMWPTRRSGIANRSCWSCPRHLTDRRCPCGPG
jgi:hypothetical protein